MEDIERRKRTMDNWIFYVFIGICPVIGFVIGYTMVKYIMSKKKLINNNEKE